MGEDSIETDPYDGRPIRADHVALDPSWKMVERVDLASGDLGERKKTSQGGMVARANLTRTGVLTYVSNDGTVRRELRHPDEVFDPRSLATLAHATLTNDHPDEVTPSNWKRVAIGHVAGTPHRAGKFVQGEIHIQHDAAIADAEKEKLSELSCGYKCAIDPTPGVFEGEPYDAVQRQIRYNHVAAGPKGWGRAGPEVRMHLDGGVGVSGAEKPPRYVRAMPPTLEEETQARATADRLAAAEKARADTAEGELTKLRADALKNDGELAGLRKLQAQQTATQTAATEALRNDASFDEQLEAIEAATKFIGGKWLRKRADGGRKTVEEIRKEVVTQLQPSWKTDGLPDGAIHGMYLAAVADAEKARQGRAQLHAVSSPLSQFVQDKANPFKKGAAGSDDDDDANADSETQKAQDAMFQRQKDAWKLPKRDRKGAGVRPDSGKLVPSRGAFGGGNQGNASGGFGGGM